MMPELTWTKEPPSVPGATSSHPLAANVPGCLSDDGLMVSVVLVDFGDTLANETFMWHDGVLPGHQHRAGSSASAGSFAGARDR
jgi:hypothetical protein